MSKNFLPSDLYWAREMLAVQALSQAAVAKRLGTSVSTLRRHLKTLDVSDKDVVQLNAERALKLHASLSQQLYDVIQRLGDRPEEKGVPDLIRLHAKSLLALISADQDIAKAMNERTGLPSNELEHNEDTQLDLALAREEIYRRMARLREESQASPDVFGEPE